MGGRVIDDGGRCSEFGSGLTIDGKFVPEMALEVMMVTREDNGNCSLHISER